MGGNIADDGKRGGGDYEFTGLAALPGMALGAVADAPSLTVARVALGTGYGAAAFLAVSVGLFAATNLARASRK